MLLLVEDTRDNKARTLRALEKNDINEVVVARDGEEALDYLFGTGGYASRDLTDMPDVVFLDLKLPRMDGFEVLRRMRAEERTWLLPVVILTSSNEEQDRMEAYAIGANSFVHKPEDHNEFQKTIRQLALYWLTLNEPVLPMNAILTHASAAP
jgi:two-component system response regulator